MAILGLKTRIVTFRVSEEEHQRLIDICVQKRCRSVSAYAREAVMEGIRYSGGSAPLLGTNLALLKVELERLYAALSTAAEMTCRVLGSGPGAGVKRDLPHEMLANPTRDKPEHHLDVASECRD